LKNIYGCSGKKGTTVFFIDVLAQAIEDQLFFGVTSKGFKE